MLCNLCFLVFFDNEAFSVVKSDLQMIHPVEPSFRLPFFIFEQSSDSNICLDVLRWFMFFEFVRIINNHAVSGAFFAP